MSYSRKTQQITDFDDWTVAETSSEKPIDAMAAFEFAGSRTGSIGAMAAFEISTTSGCAAYAA
jgi:hypothetical protein